MARCAVYKCINGRIKRGLQRTDKVVYHKFPKNPKFATLWWQATKRRRATPCKSDCICSEHFTNDSYVRDLQHELLGLPPRKRLRENAIPSLHLPVFPQGAIKKIKVRNAPKRKRGRPKATSNDQHMSTRERMIDFEDIEKEVVEFKPSIDYNASQNLEPRKVGIKTTYNSKEDPAHQSIFESTTDQFRSEDSPVQRLQNDFHCQNLLRNMFLDDALMDVVLIAEDRNIKAHRAVLRQASGYFQQVLSLDVTVESEITLKDIIYEDLVKIIGFIYLGEVSVQSSNLYRFLKTAEKLEIFSLLPWSDDSEGSDKAFANDRRRVEEGRGLERTLDQVFGKEISANKSITEYYSTCNSNAVQEHNHPHSSDSFLQLDKRRELLPLPSPNLMGVEEPLDYDTTSRMPVEQFSGLYSKSYPQMVTNPQRDAMPSDSLTFGSSNPVGHYISSSSAHHHFHLSPSFSEQTIIHEL